MFDPSNICSNVGVVISFKMAAEQYTFHKLRKGLPFLIVISTD
jgi:hypothetical protein